jgi:peptidoglycan hydrolase-like protein with peptidoglycan-binding domain
VRAFQRDRDLRATGRIDDRTWTALLASGPRPVLKRGSEGPHVRRVQRALTAALPGSVAVHGHFGPGTTQHVRRYQRRVDLQPTGVVSPGTWRALRAGLLLDHTKPERGHKKSHAKDRKHHGHKSKGHKHKAHKHKAHKHHRKGHGRR